LAAIAWLDLIVGPTRFTRAIRTLFLPQSRKHQMDENAPDHRQQQTRRHKPEIGCGPQRRFLRIWSRLRRSRRPVSFGSIRRPLSMGRDENADAAFRGKRELCRAAPRCRAKAHQRHDGHEDCRQQHGRTLIAAPCHGRPKARLAEPRHTQA